MVRSRPTPRSATASSTRAGKTSRRATSSSSSCHPSSWRSPTSSNGWRRSGRACSSSTRRTASRPGATTSGPTTCGSATSSTASVIRVTLALTATASPPVREEIVSRLHMRDAHQLVCGFDRPNIYLEVVPARAAEAKAEAVVLRAAGEPKPGIVYAATRKDAEDYAAALTELGLRACCYHAGMRARRPQRRALDVPRRRARRRRCDDRVRDGHRQAQRALRPARRRAGVARCLLPGDRPCRP